MTKHYLLITLLLISVYTQAQEHQETKAIHHILDQYHRAAAQADGEKYFHLITDEAILLGTDKSERWTKKQFEKFALPFFEQGKGWSYTSKQRHITVMSSGTVAFFDEVLENNKYGICRGSGVLILTPQGWRINQYNLSILLPNGIADKVVKKIKEFEQ